MIFSIKAGRFKAIRLSKKLLGKNNNSGRVPRKGWEKTFTKMHARGDDKLFIQDVFKDESFEKIDDE